MDQIISPPGYRLIKDVPSDSDAFGSHARVANAVVQTLDANPDLKAVALVGPWGSGKSTVLRLFDRLLTSRPAPPEAATYTFDAWLHHGEPIQRAFLEDFSRFCAQRKPTAAEAIKHKVDLVTGRATVTETFDEPRISWGGLAVLASIAIAAFGLAQGHRMRRLPFVDAILSHFPNWLPVALPLLLPTVTVSIVAISRIGRRYNVARSTNASLAFSVLLLTGWLRCLSVGWHPAAVALAATACLAVAVVALVSASQRPATDEAKAGRPTMPPDSLLGLLLNRQHQNRRTHVSGRPSPTAIDFSATFRELLALAFPPTARLVLVVDNLDRLSPSDARDAWAMLRTFFYTPPDLEYPQQRPPVVLVPVADEILRAMHGDAATSFVDKTFDITFYLPPPVLVHWQDYLHRRMEEVFGASMDPEWPRQVTHLTDAAIAARAAARTVKTKIRAADERITPRQINNLVNQISSYWLQCKADDVVFATVAYYCLHKDDFDRDLLEAATVARAAVDVYDRSWQETVAALHFGVPRSVALPVLLSPSIERAVAQRDSPVFRNLMAVPGSEAILLRILDGYRNARAQTHATPFNVVRLVEDAAAVDRIVTPVVWRLVVDIISANHAPWEPLSRQNVDDLIALMKHREALDRGMFAAINRRMQNMATAPSSPDEQAALWRHAAEHYPEDMATLPAITIAGGANTIIGVVCQLDDLPILSRLTTVAADAEGVTTALNADLTRGEQPENAVRRLLAIHRTQIRVVWEKHLATAVGVLDGGVGPNINAGTMSKLVPVVLSVILNHRISDNAQAASEQAIRGRGAAIAQFGAQTGAPVVTGLALAAHAVLNIPLPSIVDVIPESQWPRVVDGFVMGLDADADSSGTGLPDIELPADPLSTFDYQRLLSHAKRRLEERRGFAGKPASQRIVQTISSAPMG